LTVWSVSEDGSHLARVGNRSFRIEEKGSFWCLICSEDGFTGMFPTMEAAMHYVEDLDIKNDDWGTLLIRSQNNHYRDIVREMNEIGENQRPTTEG